MINIEKYSLGNYEQLVKILKEAELFDEVWESDKNIRGLVQKDPESIFVAKEKGKILGCVFVIPYGTKLHYLFRLAVLKKYRKKGIGTALIEKAIKTAKKKGVLEVGMFVDSKNKSLLKFYEKRNFIKSKKSYYYMWRGNIGDNT